MKLFSNFLYLIFFNNIFNSLTKNVPLKKNLLNKGFGTRIIHAGCEADPVTGNIVPSITLGTTFAQNMPGEKPGKDCENSYGEGYFYSRQSNPTRGALERALAISENAKHASVFSSGMAAISSIIHLLESGDHIIALDNLYGGTINYFTKIATKSNGINFTFTNADNFTFIDNDKSPNINLTFTESNIQNKLQNIMNNRTKIIWLESPTNPLLKTINIREIAKIAKINNCLLVVDATFCSPYLMNALELGADIVIHSATKYIGGHSDILMGAIMCNDNNLIKKIRFIQSGVGAVPSPFECYLALRGLKTLHLRMEACQKNAMKIAEFLEGHEMIEKVIYPGLKSYEYYKLAKSQTRGPGGMITVYIKGDLKIVTEFLRNLKIFTLAVSLGAVESLICSPALMIPGSVSKNENIKNEITDNLVRISIGIEDCDDLIEDLNQALKESKKIDFF